MLKVVYNFQIIAYNYCLISLNKPGLIISELTDSPAV